VLAELNVVEQRYRAVLEVLDWATVTDVTVRYGEVADVASVVGWSRPVERVATVCARSRAVAYVLAGRSRIKSRLHGGSEGRSWRPPQRCPRPAAAEGASAVRGEHSGYVERSLRYRRDVARPRQFDPDVVLESAMREFWERGYRKTSVDDLVAATGVRPGSLYHAFPGGKRRLFLESLDRYSRLVVPKKMGALERPGAGLVELRAYFDGLVADLTTRGGRIGCLMVNSTMELAAVDSEVGKVVCDHMARLERNAARALRYAQRQGEVSAQLDAAAKAKQLMATGMGLMVVGKTNPGRKALETIVDAVFADLG
jgi:TetR/AcrR family transcriptional regulator, transcriptional repressor for nem operon